MASMSPPAPNSNRNRFLAVLAISLLALAVFSVSAQACSYSGGTAVFSPWGDKHNYVLAPDGGFEGGGSGWQLKGDAAVVQENESYHLSDAADSKSLSLPAGSSATSPMVCMAIDTPSFRFLARNSGDPSSQLRVEAVYKLLGLVRTKVAATIRAGSSWAPSQSVSTMLTLSTVVGTLVPSAVEIRFSPLDSSGNWQIDDLYVDPFRR